MKYGVVVNLESAGQKHYLWVQDNSTNQPRSFSTIEEAEEWRKAVWPENSEVQELK